MFPFLLSLMPHDGDDPKAASLVEEAFEFAVEDMFEEFRARLDALLTTALRDKPVQSAVSETKDGKLVRPSVS